MRGVTQAARASHEYFSSGNKGWTLRRLAVAGALGAVVILCWRFAEIRPTALLDPAGVVSIGNFIRNLFPPDISLQFLRVVAVAAGQTIAIAVASTSLSVGLGLLLGFLGTPVLWERGVMLDGEPPGIRRIVQSTLSRLARAVLGFLRAVPDLLWALLFVVAVGLGPLAGTLALSVSYAGVLGRVYAHLFEDVDPSALEALHASGATRVQVFLRAIWPQAASNVTAYTLYSFECCLRAASVLGFIGAGGIGYEINVSMRLFEYGQVLTLLLTLIAMVAVTDSLSRTLRRRLNANAVGGHLRTSFSSGMRPSPLRYMSGKQIAVSAIVLAIGLSFYVTGFVNGAVADFGAITRMGNFAARLLTPNFEIEFLRSLLLPLSQTIAIAVMGTLMGISIAAVLALPATSTIVLNDRDAAGRRSWMNRTARRLVYTLARLVLNGLRSVPELVWVLVCILAVGLGPFAGTLAIGLHTGGVLGKLYAETLEEVPERPIEAMRAIGARPPQLLVWAIWPQARPMLLSYTVLRWETNLRVSTILGLVGGGGLGQIIYNSVQLGFYSNLATLILLVYILVITTDWISDRIRGQSGGFYSMISSLFLKKYTNWRRGQAYGRL
jgi:phosphonate transport system permease protein